MKYSFLLLVFIVALGWSSSAGAIDVCMSRPDMTGYGCDGRELIPYDEMQPTKWVTDKIKELTPYHWGTTSWGVAILESTGEKVFFVTVYNDHSKIEMHFSEFFEESDQMYDLTQEEGKGWVMRGDSIDIPGAVMEKCWSISWLARLNCEDIPYGVFFYLCIADQVQEKFPMVFRSIVPQ